MATRSTEESNRRAYAHQSVKRAVAKMVRLAEDLAETSVALEWDYSTIEYTHWLMDEIRKVQSDVNAYVDQGQLHLPL